MSKLALAARKYLKKSGRKLLIWSVCTFVASVLPLGARGLYTYYNHTLHSPYDLVMHGELFLLSVALATHSIGELHVNNKAHFLAGNIFFWIFFILFSFFLLMYSMLSVGTVNNQQGIEGLGSLSLSLYVTTYLFSVACKVYVEG